LALTRSQLLRLAQHGAAARLQELQNEITAIQRAFPDLRGGAQTGRKSGKRAGVPKRRQLSKAARKAISEAQKKRWAKVKAAKK
jgi:hypothetical protein